MTLALDTEIAASLQALLAGMPTTSAATNDPVEARREAVQGFLAHAARSYPAYDQVASSDHHIRTSDGARILARWYTAGTAAAGRQPAAVYFHGGGMIAGDLDLFEGPVRHYVAESGTPILSVDYRLAPEHAHPTPVEDAYASLVWLHDRAAELGVDADRIAVMGDSAGGGLAAAVAILARGRGGPAIAKQILLMPMLDDRPRPADRLIEPFASWTSEDNRIGWTALLGDRAGGATVPAEAAPARVVDAAGLPAAYIDVGQLDIFRDESIEFARVLIRAGTPVELHVHPGLPHLLPTAAPQAAVVRRLVHDRVRALREI